MKLGEACWKNENVEKSISHIAQLDATRSHYFLASHSPIQFIRNERLGKELSDEQLFQALFETGAHEQLILVQGEPGNGKSHLIYWLKLRCQYALETGELKDALPVIIQRRSGSLKDALDQLIRQLPTEFQHYLNPVKEALGKISDATAREVLAGKLFLEFGDSWQMKGHPSLPGYLKDMREICTSMGFRRWLCRDGGVIDRNVKRLTETSMTEEREQLPEFTEEEFYIRDPRYTAQNTPAVMNFIDDFMEYRERREEAAQAFNRVLPSAIKEMTGLSGTTLRDIFDQIRSDLKGMGKSLALFIEDVSVMSALDEEVINAVEPQGRQDLCPITAVLGITDAGVLRLPPNQKQRVTSFFSVGGYGTEQWRADIDEVARFAARYLNTVRLDEAGVRNLASDRRAGAEVTVSGCEKCPVREECHGCFGKVEVEGMAVGMFPFTYEAPQRLLEHLDEQREGVRKNPRGLLMHVLRQVLLNGESLNLGTFPEDNLPVALPPLMYWQTFERKYCGGWAPREIKRLDRFARGWIAADSEEEAAATLRPFLDPLGFRGFSRNVEKRERTAERENRDRKKAEEKKTERGGKGEMVPAELQNLLQDLDNWWNQGRELQFDQLPRQLLAELVRKALPWDDDNSVPLSEWKKFIGGGATNYKFIKIEGMRSRVTGNFSIEFARSKESHDLISALAKFKYLGKDSWDFQGGEAEKRTVSVWLRRRGEETIRGLQPGKALDLVKPVTFAAQCLAIASMLRKRSRLPEDLVELVEEVLADIWKEPPTTFDGDWTALVKDMQIRHANMREFLFNELGVTQGRTGGIVFIDPLPIIDAVGTLFQETFKPLDRGYFENFWESRYAVFNRMDRYGNLADILEQERSALESEATRLKGVLKSAGYDPDQPREAIAGYCKDLLQVVDAQRTARVLEPDNVFDDMLKNKIFGERQSVWGVAIEKTGLVVGSEDLVQLLVHDPKSLQEAVFAISYSDNYLKKLAKEAEQQLLHIEQEGDPDALFNEFMGYLDNIAQLGKEISSKSPGEQYDQTAGSERKDSVDSGQETEAGPGR